MTSRDEAESLIRASVPPDSVEAIVGALRPSVRVVTVRVASEEDIPVGASKFGGLPRVPPGFAWPTVRATPNAALRKMYYDSKRRPDGSLPDYLARMRAELDGRDDPHDLPLDFLAQINLAHLQSASEMGFPDRGILYFFERDDVPLGGVSADRDLHRVVYVDAAGDDLAPADVPGPPSRRTLRPCRLELVPQLMLPFGPECEFLAVPGYGEVLGQLLSGIGGTDQWIGGYPYPTQGDPFHEMEIDDRRAAGTYRSPYESPGNEPYEPPYDEIERAERELATAAARRWRLLLQLDTDENVGWMWGDVGKLYFLIPADDLRDHRFDRAKVVLQSY